MPYKNKEKNLKARRNWYKKNKGREIQRQKDRIQIIKRWYSELKKTLQCSRCPENHPKCLDFHHENQKDKFMDVSKMVHEGYSIERIKKEIKKCVVLCANCHRKLM